jgi:NAD(P)-dependent dehydrogenase (short-subunit alcohol dehydrogenase family)
MSEQTALIIGASRGLGLAMVQEYHRRGWSVTGTVRGGGTGLHDFAGHTPDRLRIEMLDITVPLELQALRARLSGQSFDLLFVNAGIANGAGEILAQKSDAEFFRLLHTNTLAPMRAIEALQDLVTPTGTIGVMSSGLGSVANNTAGGWEIYRASKAGLNTLMRSFAVRPEAGDRSLVVMAPGWVRTDMGGPNALLSIDESIPGVVNTMTALAGQKGCRYVNYKGETIPW